MHVYGIVRNLIRKNIPTYDRIAKDKKILGVFGLAWAVFQSALPKAVTDACDDAMETSGMPSMTYNQDMECV